MSDDYQKDRKDRFAAEVQREGFADLHERQKATFEVQQDQNDHWNHGHLSHQSLPRLKFYVTLTDPALGPFISDAQQKVKRAYLAGTRFWHHHYSIDIADVVIDLNGRTCNIRIAPIDSFNYEFVTSGFPVVKSTLIQESIAFDTYNAVGINGKVILQNNLMTVTSQVTKQKRSTTGAVSTIERPFQIELLHEPANNPNGVQAFNRWRYRDSLFRSFAPYTPHSGLLVRSTLAHYRTFQLNNSIGPGHVHYTRDSYLDVPYQRADRSNPITSAYVRGAADWPRSNGVQTVHSPFGVREFVIYVDANGTFNVFPTGAITTPSGYTQNVPDDHVQRITPTWPAWMYTPSVKHKDYVLGDPDSQHLLVDLPDWEWKFNHLGTKAAAIVYERSAYSYDTTFWSTDVNIHQPFTSTKFDDLAADMGVHVLLQGASADSHSPQVYFNAPGIIEATVDITLTGGALKDFTATVTLREVRRPTTSTTTAVPAYVGYVWYDIPGGGQKADSTPITAKAGDFVVVDMELWVQPIGATGGSTKRFVLMSVKDLNDGREIMSTVGRPVINCDLTTLSFAIKLDHFEYVLQNRTPRAGGAPADINYSLNPFGIWVIHSAKSKEVLFPNSLTQPQKDTLNALTLLSGRAQLAQLMTDTISDGAWEMMPLTTPKDGWTDASINSYRNYWAYQKHFWYNDWWVFVDPDYPYNGTSYPTQGYVQYKVSGAAPGYPVDGDATQQWLNKWGADFQHLFFCDNPKWGWHIYQRILANYAQLDLASTFYTHANGSFFFYNDSFIYNGNGVPGVAGAGFGDVPPVTSGLEWTYDSLTPFDAAKVEHVIFDRIHFEIKTVNGTIGQRNTTFVDLYNSAVRAGKKAQTLEEGIEEILPNTLQASFAKEIGNDGPFDFLDLHMNWDGANWWFSDQIVIGLPDAFFPPFTGTGGCLTGLSTYQFWSTTNRAGGGDLEVAGFPQQGHSDWHVRFANALIINTK
jgi:hypothetical protein